MEGPNHLDQGFRWSVFLLKRLPMEDDASFLGANPEIVIPGIQVRRGGLFPKKKFLVFVVPGAFLDLERGRMGVHQRCSGEASIPVEVIINFEDGLGGGTFDFKGLIEARDLFLHRRFPMERIESEFYLAILGSDDVGGDAGAKPQKKNREGHRHGMGLHC